MTAILKTLEALALAALIAVLCVVVVILYQLRPKLLVTVSNVDRAVIALGAAASNVEQGAREWKKASSAQAQQATNTETQAAQSLLDLDAMIRRTNRSVNDELAPKLSAAVDGSVVLIRQATADLDTTTQRAADSFIALDRVLSSAASTVGDPHIREAIERLDEAAAGVDVSTQHLAGVTKDVQIVADKFKDDYVKPANRAWVVFKALLGLGSESRILFAK